jgi:hypothetical protein
VIWRSTEDASKAMWAEASSDACRSYFACMAEQDHVEPENSVTLYRSLKTYGAMALQA